VIFGVLQKVRIAASQVKAIGITTQRGSFLLWNKYEFILVHKQTLVSPTGHFVTLWLDKQGSLFATSSLGKMCGLLISAKSGTNHTPLRVLGISALS